MSGPSYGDDVRVKITEAQTRILGRKFCTACQAMQVAETGKIVPASRGAKRWICAACVLRRDKREGFSIYSSKPR